MTATLMPESEHPMVVALSRHLASLQAIRALYPALSDAIAPLDVEAGRIYDDVVDAGQPEHGPPDKRRHDMPLTKTNDFLFASRAYENSSRALVLLPRSLLVAMVSQHDAFIGDLVRALYALDPALLDGIDRTYAYRDVKGLSTERLRERVVEDEIVALLHESHTKQILQLQHRLNMRLDSDGWLLARFNELCQRRNLYAHAGGIVSRGYVGARRAIDRGYGGQPGDVLTLDAAEFESAYVLLVEMAVKLWQVTWRHVRGDEAAVAEEALYRLNYMLLVFEEFSLAQLLLEFALDLPQQPCEATRRKNIINLAQAHKWQGDETACARVVEDDWTACEDSFALALAVLRDDFDEAARLMVEVGRRDDIVEQAFRDWPLLREFRKTPQFAAAYKTLYGDRGSEEVA